MTPNLANDTWGDDADAAFTARIAQRFGAFALAAGFVITLQPGIYTVVGSSAVAGGAGAVLFEVYVVPKSRFNKTVAARTAIISQASVETEHTAAATTLLKPL